MLHLTPFLTVYCCVLAALLGACMGSFLNCMAWRVVHGESALRGRSHCDACGHVLGAAVFVSLLLHYDISLRLLEAWFLASILLACSFADLEGYIIPDRFLAAGLVLFIASLFFAPAPLGRLADGLLGGFGVALGLLAVVTVLEKRMGREAMGGGDLKLLFVTGLFFGWKGNLLCLILACIFGIVFGLLAAGRGGEKGAPIPWGPSIALGAWVTALAGEPFIRWYLSLL